MSVFSFFRRKVYNVFHPELGQILMLHRVTEQRSRLSANREIEITPAFLEQTLINYQRKGFRFASLDEVFDVVRRGKTKQKFVCFTLDDGYKDNYTTAYPIFKKYDCPFAVNVTTDFFEHKALLWWYVLEDLGVSEEEFQAYRDKIFQLKPDAMEKAFKEWFPNVTYSFVHKVNEMALTVEQIKEMADSGLCTIGNHTVSHPNLLSLSAIEQKYEIETAQKKLQELTGSPVKHFAYPYGYYNHDTLDVIGKLGIETAVLTWGGKVRKGAALDKMNRIELKED